MRNHYFACEAFEYDLITAYLNNIVLCGFELRDNISIDWNKINFERGLIAVEVVVFVHITVQITLATDTDMFLDSYHEFEIHKLTDALLKSLLNKATRKRNELMASSSFHKYQVDKSIEKKSLINNGSIHPGGIFVHSQRTSIKRGFVEKHGWSWMVERKIYAIRYPLISL